jgi:hypothetical protein
MRERKVGKTGPIEKKVCSDGGGYTFAECKKRGICFQFLKGLACEAGCPFKHQKGSSVALSVAASAPPTAPPVDAASSGQDQELDLPEPRGVNGEVDPAIDALLAERELARRRGDYATADRLRDSVRAQGIIVDDRYNGHWHS